METITDITQLGFESLAELMEIVASVDISTRIKKRRFDQWKRHDGTLNGLLVVKAQNQLGNKPRKIISSSRQTSDRLVRAISLGGGVQSSTILLMSIVGVLPRIDAAIFADTQSEPKKVYQHLDWLASQAAKAGIPVIRVTAGNLYKDSMVFMKAGAAGKRRTRDTASVEGRWASLPLFVKNPDGSKGIIRRQCTKEYKIEILNREMRRLMGFEDRARVKGVHLETWVGISADESQRMRTADNTWQTLHYPLIEDFSPAMTRQDCINWLIDHSYPVPPKSACIICPFHSDREWRAIKEDPEEWAMVVEYDRTIRHCGGMRGHVYLHASLKPIEEVDFSTAAERGQGNWINECVGVCGV